MSFIKFHIIKTRDAKIAKKYILECPLSKRASSSPVRYFMHPRGYFVTNFKGSAFALDRAKYEIHWYEKDGVKMGIIKGLKL